MQFKVINYRQSEEKKKRKNSCYLIMDDWNDYGFYTKYFLVYFDKNGKRREIGTVKIGEIGQLIDVRCFNVDDKFNYLKPNYFSLGQSDEYYDKLKKLGKPTKELILKSLNDIANVDFPFIRQL